MGGQSEHDLSPGTSSKQNFQLGRPTGQGGVTGTGFYLLLQTTGHWIKYVTAFKILDTRQHGTVTLGWEQTR